MKTVTNRQTGTNTDMDKDTDTDKVRYLEWKPYTIDMRNVWRKINTLKKAES